MLHKNSLSDIILNTSCSPKNFFNNKNISIKTFEENDNSNSNNINIKLLESKIKTTKNNISLLNNHKNHYIDTLKSISYKKKIDLD